MNGTDGAGADSSAERRGGYAAGDFVGERFKLVRPLGEGGMGTVWVARDRVLAVLVAVKLVSLPGHDNRALARRVLEEARTAARLGHAAIVRINDFGITKLGDPYLAMELLDGEDLAQTLARCVRLGPVEAVTTLLPIAHALATAHESGIVHRDVKPENIFLAKTELGTQPKLLDFGIARFTDRTHRLTMEGAVLGTPDYLSPQVAKGETATSAADIWSTSVVLYEMVSGSCPFHADSYYALVRSIIDDQPVALGELGVDEPELEAIIRRGLEKDVARRWGSMRELGQQLAQWCLQRGVTEDVAGQSIRRVWLRDGDGSVVETTGAPASVALGGAPRSGGAGELVRVTRGSLTESHPSEPELAALAALHQVGDPVDRFARASVRRAVGVGAVLVTGVLVVLLVFLAGAGFFSRLGP